MTCSFPLEMYKYPPSQLSRTSELHFCSLLLLLLRYISHMSTAQPTYVRTKQHNNTHNSAHPDCSASYYRHARSHPPPARIPHRARTRFAPAIVVTR